MSKSILEIPPIRDFIYPLGAKARDKITGFTGIIDAEARWINGCNKYSLQPPVDKEGKVPVSYWFDELNIEILELPKIKDKKVATGGPMMRSK